tara:strand:+ start:7214 stop:7543 length:330 start_codon:yes stop_codon:yes gene_type:complete
MGLKVKNFQLPDETFLEEAYLKVQNIGSVCSDYEFLENLPDGNQKVSWLKKIESTALIYVWSDEGARENRAQVQHWFQIEFNYDLSEWTNIYEQAYNKLKILFPEGEGC